MKTALIAAALLVVCLILYVSNDSPSPVASGLTSARQVTLEPARDSSSLDTSPAAKLDSQRSAKGSGRQLKEASSPRPHVALSPTHQATLKGALKGVLGVDQAPEASLGGAPQEQPEGAGEEAAERMVFSTDREGIQGAVEEMNDQIRECYHGWVQSNPELQGRVTLSFTISPPEEGDEGGLSQIKEAQLLVDDLAHPMMSACLINSAEGLQFEAVDSPATVHYPYHFSSPSPERP